MAENRVTLKEFFETGDKPTEAQFADLIDSLFALADDNTVQKVIIVAVPVVGDGSGAKTLKRGDLLIQMGEYSENDLSITTDDGAFSAGGSAYISDSQTVLYWNGLEIFQAFADFTGIKLSNFTQINMNDTAGVESLSILAKDSITFGGAGVKMGFFNTPAIAKPAIAGSRGGNVALANLLIALDNLGLITDNTVI